ncbi:MAG: inositol monophosphatase family protein [Ilumatobacteraceae bacterium]
MNGQLDRVLLDLAARLAVDAGRMVRRGRAEHGITAASSKSTATDIVTEFDRASEQFVLTGILDARPSDGVVGEEGTGVAGTSGVEWLVDPIDGTTNFLYGLPGYAVSIAAAVDGAPRAGAVYVPATDELFTAVAGGGAHLDGRRIHCTGATDLAAALVATGFSYRSERRAEQAERLALVLPRIRDIRRCGAAAPDLCHLAAGRVDAYFEQWLGPWDHAAGALIARESGCRTAGAADGVIGSGLPGEGDWVVAAPASLFPALESMLREVEATRRSIR